MTKASIKAGLKKAFTTWVRGDNKLILLFGLLDKPVQSLTHTDNTTYNELVYDVLDDIVEALSKSSKKIELRENMPVIRRYIAAQVFSQTLLFHDPKKEMDVTVDNMKEVLFYLSVLHGRLKTTADSVTSLGLLEERIEKESEIFKEIALERLNRKKQAELTDHINTDPTYPTEMTNMLVKKPAAAPTPKATKPPAKKVAVKTTATSEAKPAASVEGKAGKVPMSPFQRLQQATRQTPAPEPVAPPVVKTSKVAVVAVGRSSTKLVPTTTSVDTVTATAVQPNVHPVKGTLLKTMCEDHTAINYYADGYGGEYSQKTLQAVECGYKVPERQSNPTIENYSIEDDLIRKLSDMEDMKDSITGLLTEFLKDDTSTYKEWMHLSELMKDKSSFADILTAPLEELITECEQRPSKEKSSELLTLVTDLTESVRDINKKFERLAIMMSGK